MANTLPDQISIPAYPANDGIDRISNFSRLPTNL